MRRFVILCIILGNHEKGCQNSLANIDKLMFILYFSKKGKKGQYKKYNYKDNYINACISIFAFHCANIACIFVQKNHIV